MRYAAFLRGLNTGGNRMVGMKALARAFESLGFENVKTVLASGNVVFDARAKDAAGLERKIEEGLPRLIGFRSVTFVRSQADLQAVIRKDPFKGIAKTRQTKLLVTFVKGRPAVPLPAIAGGRAFGIVGSRGDAVFGVVDLGRAGTPDLMKVLDKAYGERETTRTWDTVARVAGA